MSVAYGKTASAPDTQLLFHHMPSFRRSGYGSGDRANFQALSTPVAGSADIRPGPCFDIINEAFRGAAICRGNEILSRGQIVEVRKVALHCYRTGRGYRDALAAGSAAYCTV